MKNLALKKIEDDIKKVLKPALKQTAIDLNRMIEQAYEDAVQAFYDDYEPMYYRRTFSTYKASDLWENPTKQQNPIPMGEGFIAGIEVSSDNIPGHPYNRSPKDKPNKTEWVFNRTFTQGIHGVSNPEKRLWGKNNYWDKYRKIVQGKKSKYMINQYYRDVHFKPSADRLSKAELEKFNIAMREWANSYASGNNFIDFKVVSAVQPETRSNKNGQMIGTTPKKILDNAFLHIKSNRNVSNILYQNIFNELIKVNRRR